MKIDAIVFRTLFKAAFKSLQIQTDQSLDLFMNNVVKTYQETFDERSKNGESYDIGDPDDFALDVFIYKLEMCLDEAKAIKAVNREIKPILKPKK